jgi:hypothetical protein
MDGCYTGQRPRKGHMVAHRWMVATQGRGLGRVIWWHTQMDGCYATRGRGLGRDTQWHTQMDGCYTGQRPRKGHMVAHTDGWLIHRAEA